MGTKEQQLNINFRPYTTSDFNFIINSWLRSSHELFPYRKINTKHFNKINTPILASLILQSNILIAANSEDANHIFGYLAYERIEKEVILYWLYVKKELRNFGIATQLINNAIPEFTKQQIAITSMPNFKQIQKTNVFFAEQRNSNKEDKIVDVLEKYNLVFDPYIINRKVNV